LRDELCGALDIPVESVRVVVGDVGGGFGMKTALYAEDVIAAFATKMLKRPVKWTGERSEEFLAASHGRDLLSKVELALDKDGKILALRVHTEANMGAYATPAGVVDPAADRTRGWRPASTTSRRSTSTSARC
jgi:carbon-monoxide dehydrogenase large subunit